MKNFISKLYKNHSLIYKVFLFIASTTLIVYLFPKGGQFKYEFFKGKPWQYDNYYAPFQFAIYKSDEEIKKEKSKIKEKSKLYFNYNTNIVKSVKKVYYSKIDSVIAQANLAEHSKVELRRIGNSFLNKIYKYGVVDAAEADKLNSKPIISLVTGNEVQNIPSNKFIVSNNLLLTIHKFFTLNSRFEKYEDLFDNLFFEIVKANVSYNDKLTNQLLNEALKNISYTKGYVAEKERIISKGDVVEGRKLEILNSLKKEYKSKLWTKANYNWIVFGYIILVSLAMFMLFLFLQKYRRKIFENNKKVTFIFLNIILIVALVTFVVKYNANYVYVVPLVLLPLVIKAFFDARLGLFTHVLTILLLGFIVPNSFEFTFLQIIAGIVTILTISEIYKRANLFISVGQITLIYFIAYFAFSIIQEGNIHQFKWLNIELFVLNGIITISVVFPLIFFYEKVFGLVSDETLRELSDSNSKLLKELAEKAPGTFQHSMQVANLAEAAATEIGANAMLVRTGALYHDIGKMKNPMYFTENQLTGVNPHHDLNPKDSAKIIIDHVITGIEMAKKNNLPDRIIDFIRTHHGTSLTYYFYKLEEENNPVELNKEDFRYPGPIPFSKETAILMMCDASEAASKSLKEPTAMAVDNLVEKIIDGQMKNGQFMNADITFKEIQIIKKIIKKKLLNIYHLRIEYPE